jgi:hypothetical protein
VSLAEVLSVAYVDYLWGISFVDSPFEFVGLYFVDHLSKLAILRTYGLRIPVPPPKPTYLCGTKPEQ